MAITKEQHKEMEELARPLIKWLNDNCHPMSEIRIEHNRVELLEGVAASPINDYIKD